MIIIINVLIAVINLISSITKFSIVICSIGAYMFGIL